MADNGNLDHIDDTPNSHHPTSKTKLQTEVERGIIEGASFSPASFIAPGRSDCSTLGRLTMGRK
jgi:hypothetical protein